MRQACNEHPNFTYILLVGFLEADVRKLVRLWTHGTTDTDLAKTNAIREGSKIYALRSKRQP